MADDDASVYHTDDGDTDIMAQLTVEGAGDGVTSLGQDTLVDSDLHSAAGILSQAGEDGIVVAADSLPVTLQSLLGLQSLATGRVFQTSSGEAIEILTLPVSLAPGGLISLNGTTIDVKNLQLQMLPLTGAGPLQTIVHNGAGDASEHIYLESQDLSPSEPDSMLMPPPPTPRLPSQPRQPLPPSCPAWAALLKDCEFIGDSYRGWVDNDYELEVLLTSHKQQTGSTWGTRQSPNPAKPSTRLMWKSQYVPFDGIPFVNTGSRAVVMECAFGPRRKGGQFRKALSGEVMKGEFRQSCPARIYIKKVRKFPSYAVSTFVDKKAMKTAMEKAFHELRCKGYEMGVERYYVQLPTPKAHEFHLTNQPPPAPTPVAPPDKPEEKTTSPNTIPSRLHPEVAEKIRAIVASGETRVYAIRKQLRRFVVKELSEWNDRCERHNLTLFPTVNDLQNHVHQALKDIQTGKLEFTAPLSVAMGDTGYVDSVSDSWNTGLTVHDTHPQPETVTVTLTQAPGEGHHVISRVETRLSDGTTRVTTSLTPETAQLLAKLNQSVLTLEQLQYSDGGGMSRAEMNVRNNQSQQSNTVTSSPPTTVAPYCDDTRSNESSDSFCSLNVSDMVKREVEENRESLGDEHLSMFNATDQQALSLSEDMDLEVQIGDCSNETLSDGHVTSMSQ